MTSTSQNEWPVKIVSKGRPRCPTSKLMSGVNYKIIVEPREFADYLEYHPAGNLESLDENGMGIAYVRNYVLRSAQGGWVWMLDDDIQGFYKLFNGKQLNTGFAVLKKNAEETIGRINSNGGNVAQVAFEYSQFSFGNIKKQFSVNSYCDVCVAINSKVYPHNSYDREVALKEDRDFTVQLIHGGYKTARFRHLSFRAPSNGSNKGGLFGEYLTTGKEHNACVKMVEKWSKYCEIQVKKSGRVDCKIHWGKIGKIREGL